MPKYNFVALNEKGKKIKGTTTAHDQTHLKEKLRGNNIYLVSFSLAGVVDLQKDTVDNVKVFSARVNEPVLMEFFFQLSAMLRSGITLTVALNALQTRGRQYRYFIFQLYKDVFSGLPLSAAMENQPNHFSAFVIYSIKAGENSGNLDKQLMSIADKFQANAETTKLLRKETSYYLMVFIFLMVVSTAFTFIISMIKGTKLSFSLFSLPFSMLLLLLLFFVIKRLSYLPFCKVILDFIKIKIPMIRGVMKQVYTARFAETLSLFYKSGTNIAEAFSSSIAVTDNIYITKSLGGAAEQLLAGNSLTNVLDLCSIFDASLVSSIAIGEKTGDVTDELDRVAKYCREEANIKIKAVIKLVKPIVAILLFVFVGVFIVQSGVLAIKQVVE